jgi:hypothetical protein
MRRFGGSLIGIRSLRLFGVYAISPPAGGAFPPPSRNALPRKIAGAVGHPKQNQKDKDFLQIQMLHARAAQFSGPRSRPDKKLIAATPV